MNICFCVIHIDDDSELSRYRRKYFVNTCRYLKNKIKYLNVKAFKISNQEDLEHYNKTQPAFNFSENLKYGEIGCLASHYNAWKSLLSTEQDAILIIEDDAILADTFIDSFNMYIKEIPQDFDVVSMYVHPAKTYKYNKNIHDIGLSNICLGFQNQSTLAYLISRNGAKKYIDYVDNLFDKPLDLFLFDVEKKTNFYSISPSSRPLFYTDTLDEKGEVIRETTFIQNTNYVGKKYGDNNFMG